MGTKTVKGRASAKTGSDKETGCVFLDERVPEGVEGTFTYEVPEPPMVEPKAGQLWEHKGTGQLFWIVEDTELGSYWLMDVKAFKHLGICKGSSLIEVGDKNDMEWLNRECKLIKDAPNGN